VRSEVNKINLYDNVQISLHQKCTSAVLLMRVGLMTVLLPQIPIVMQSKLLHSERPSTNNLNTIYPRLLNVGLINSSSQQP